MTESEHNDRRPAQELAAQIGEAKATAAIQAGWDALRAMTVWRPDLIHPGVADYVVATVLLGALPSLLDPNALVPDAPVVTSAPVRLRDSPVIRAKRRLFARIIASANLLDKPFTDAPDQSPWTRMKADMHALNEALEQERRGGL